MKGRAAYTKTELGLICPEVIDLIQSGILYTWEKAETTGNALPFYLTAWWFSVSMEKSGRGFSWVEEI